MNGHNKVYFVLFGNDRYYPDAHFRACRNKFDHLPEARKFASGYSNAAIFCAKYVCGTWDIEYFMSI